MFLVFKKGIWPRPVSKERQENLIFLIKHEENVIEEVTTDTLTVGSEVEVQKEVNKVEHEFATVEYSET